jgi:cysteine desulfurase
VTTTIEHPSVLAAFERLEKQGWKVTRVPVDSAGLVDAARVAAAVTPKTALVSVMLVNNEVGTIQPLAAIRKAAPGVVIHTDAAQAIGKVPVNLRDADLVTFSAHKIHGPKGVGGLWIRKGTPIAAQQVGGGQEFERRAGTENVAGAVGLSAAMKLAAPGRMEELRERLRRGLGAAVAGSGAPHILNVAFEGVDGEAAILALDAAGVCISSGSACASGSTKPSHVLTAMGLPADVVKSSVRFSLSMLTTDEDIDGALRIVPGVIDRLRKISPVTR